MKIGYARVSTKDQNLDLQKDALKEWGCEEIYCDVASGANTQRPQMQEAFKRLRKGDTLVIWKLDRLGRSLKHLIEVVHDLELKGVGLKSLRDDFIDTTTSQGKLIFNIFACLSEFERDLIRERTQAGLKAARARGRKGGRPKGLSKEAESTAYAAEALYKEGKLSIKAISDKLGVSRATLYSYLRHRGVKIGSQ